MGEKTTQQVCQFTNLDKPNCCCVCCLVDMLRGNGIKIKDELFRIYEKSINNNSKLHQP